MILQEKLYYILAYYIYIYIILYNLNHKEKTGKISFKKILFNFVLNYL